MINFKKIIEPLLAFTVPFLVFLFLEFNPNNPYFSGYDSYYHIGMAEEIWNNGLPFEFPHLYFTVLNQNFVESHLLFHLFLIPFILIFGNVIGPKIFIALCAGGIFFLVFHILKFFSKKTALISTALLFFLLPSDFYFRLAFIRNPAPSLLFLLLVLYLMIHKKYKSLILASFCYGWLYMGGGFLFLIGLTVIYSFSNFITSGKIDRKIFFYPILGTLLSLIVNPYFPTNINLFIVQVWKTGLQAKEYVGGEWRPYDTWFWFSMCIVPLFIWGLGIATALIRGKKIGPINLSILIYSAFLLVAQLKSKRFIEYWPLWASLSGIILIGPSLKIWIKSLHKSAFVFFCFLAFTIFSFIYAKNQWQTAFNDTTSDFEVNLAAKAHDYIKKNSNAGDIIFADDWDVFPLYFYLNRKNYYIVGLDPEFMNQFDRNLYLQFAQISSGDDPDNLERIKDLFKSKWVLVNRDHPEFRSNLLARKDLFKEVYSNSEYFVFEVK